MNPKPCTVCGKRHGRKRQNGYPALTCSPECGSKARRRSLIKLVKRKIK